MSQLQLFTFAEAFPLRIVDINGNPWFIAADVCTALGLVNTTRALERLDSDEVTLIDIQGASNGLPVNAINESGLYNLILTSNKPQAKPFKKWVTSDVLPSIRKTGGYGVASLPNFNDPAAAAEAWALQYRETKRLELQAEIDAPKIAFAEAVETRADEINLAKVGKHVGLPPNNFIKWMARQGLIFKRPQFGNREPHWEPKAYMETAGYIVLRQEMCHDGVTRPSARVTGKGLEYIMRLLAQKGYP